MGKEFLLARQPIVTAELKSIGFEMLYRPQAELNTSVSGDMATAHVLSTILCDAFKHELLDDTSFLFVNMTRQALMNITCSPFQRITSPMKSLKMCMSIQSSSNGWWS